MLGAHGSLKEGPVLVALTELLGPTTPLSIHTTGYSSGGSLAALAAVRLALKFPEADNTSIAFGSP